MQETTAALASPTPKLRQKSLVGNKIYGILEVNHQRTWKRTKKLLPFPTTLWWWTPYVTNHEILFPIELFTSQFFKISVFYKGIGIGIYFRNVTSSPTNWLAIYRETYNSINVTFSIKCLSSDILLFSSKNKNHTCVFATAVVFALDTHALDVRRFAVWWCPALTLWKRIGSANAKSWKKM